MPSESAKLGAADAVAGLAAAALDRFRSSLATTIAQMRGLLAGISGDEKARSRRVEASLGSFAGGRIDPARFAALEQHGREVDAGAGPVIERAIAVLEQLHGAGDSLTHVTLEPGTNLRCLMSRTLGKIGRAFGAARAVDLARNGSFDQKRHGPLLESNPFRSWSSEQRALAPMIVVQVQDGDVHATNLGEFLDGGLKVVLDFDATCSAAPVARLITPATFVLQTMDGTGLADFAAWDGPGAAALVAEGVAQFVHDPRAGASIAERLTVSFLPEVNARRNFGSLSRSQQQEDLDHLRSLAAAAVPTAPPDDPPAARPVDKLAALLLNKAHLEEV